MGKYDFALELYGDNTISWIADSIVEGSRVLEFGPANGRLTNYLTNSKKCKVDIVEIDEESGKEASRFAVNSFLGEEKGDIEKYYWLEQKEKYDFVIFADVLEHLVHPAEVLERCKAVVKEEGKVLVSIPNVSHNSIIIELFNDQFEYNPTGILDNTHLRFFTRTSFENMALGAGWTIVEEKAKNIRVGESEIKNTYQNVPKSIFRELVHRPQGDVYQYMFTLALSTDYLLGKCERVVSLDSTSYYYAEVQYSDDKTCFDYRKAVSRHFDPYYGKINITFSVIGDNRYALVKPLNCNCVLKNVQIKAISELNQEESVLEFGTNGTKIDKSFYFMKAAPELKFELPEATLSLVLSADVLKYDFDDGVFEDIFNRLEIEQKHIVQICSDYEQELSRREQEYQQELSKREQDLLRSVQEYEQELLRREQEYQQELSQREQKYQQKLNQMQAEYEYERRCREEEARKGWKFMKKK